MIENIFQAQKTFFLTQQTKPYPFRYLQLKKLYQLIKDYESDLLDALKQDLNKTTFEAYSTEIGFCLRSLSDHMKHLKKWMKPKRVKTPWYLLQTSSYIIHEPKGTVLIIGPYNYPFQLVIEPLIGAIAAGNTAIIKASEFATQTEKVIASMINDHFDASYIHVLSGGIEVASSLVKLPFDHIFFTGSTRVGKIVYESASKNLVPVTLELGGKSPCIVDASANLKVAAKRIIFGKFTNAGQTCIAPDYLYVHTSIYHQFVEELMDVIKKMYPTSTNLSSIINDHHYQRLINLMKNKNVRSFYEPDPTKRYIAPSLVLDVSWDDTIMQEEIFGPLLPILPFDSIDEVISILKTKDKPLALYLFSKNKEIHQKVWTEVSFGGGAINDTLMHISNPNIPFGGIGPSGIGHYHGKHSFDLFSHQKGYIKRHTWFDPNMVYPPHTDSKEKLIRRILK